MSDEDVQGYSGPERRKEYCPVHHIKCAEIKEANSEAKRKLPIWVFTLFFSSFIAIAGAIVGYQLSLLMSHVDKSNIVLNNLSYGLREVAHNQKLVMHKINLPYEPLKEYERNLMTE